MSNDDLGKIRIELINKFQETNDVSQIYVNNIPIWPIVLFEIRLYILKGISKKDRNLFMFALQEFFYLATLLYNLIRDRKKNTKRNLNPDFIFLTQSTRRVLLNGTYYDRICDPFIDALKEKGYKSKVLEWSYDHKFKIPRYNNSSLIQFQIEFELIKNLFKKEKLEYKLEMLNTIEFNCILKHCGTEYTEFIRSLKTTTKRIFIIAQYFNKKVKSEKVQAAFFYPYYGTVSFAFNLACKWNMIQTVEIQHGYYGERAQMQNGIRNQSTKYDLLPDFIWCWEERDKNSIKNWGNKPDILPIPYVGGNLWNNIWKYPSENRNEFSASIDKQIKSMRKEYKLIFLLTLSPIYDLPDWLTIAMKKSKDILWLVRFHHNTEQKLLRRFKKEFSELSNTHYTIANESPLPVLLRLSDLHVTVISSCVSEAREFGTKSIVLSKKGASIFKEIIEESWAFPIFTLEEFESTVGSKMFYQNMSKQFPKPSNIQSNAEIVSDFLHLLHPGN
ncbi:MAG TPA: hypothetical protein PLZ52_00975 [Bacteroidales bacterium]|nr:hypothetical protein [Bacteroidales bacterium]